MLLNANFVMSFMTNDEMNAHISKVHAKIKCQFCPSKFLTNKDLDQHITDHHGIQCKFCSKWCSPADMSAHLLSAHKIKQGLLY